MNCGGGSFKPSTSMPVIVNVEGKYISLEIGTGSDSAGINSVVWVKGDHLRVAVTFLASPGVSYYFRITTYKGGSCWIPLMKLFESYVVRAPNQTYATVIVLPV